MASIHVCLSTVDLAAIQFVRFTQRFDCILWCQVQSCQQALCMLHNCPLCLVQVDVELLSPSQLHCFKRQRQSPEEDAALNDAAAPQPAAAMHPALQLAKPTGKHVHTLCS